MTTRPSLQEQIQKALTKYLPEKVCPTFARWIVDLNIKIVLKPSRRSLYGSFSPSPKGWKITIQRNLPPLSFQGILIHELAHAYTWRKYGKVQPHGSEFHQTLTTMQKELTT